LTAYIVKTTNLYMIFGTIQHGIVLNMFVKSIFNNIITQVALLSDK